MWVWGFLEEKPRSKHEKNRTSGSRKVQKRVNVNIGKDFAIAGKLYRFNLIRLETAVIILVKHSCIGILNLVCVLYLSI